MTRSLTAPDTLTTWLGDAFCISREDGIGLADTTTLLVSQDFFSELKLPYSVKRGETFPLNISVFNYLTTELPVTLTIRVNKKEIRTQKSKIQVCVPPQSNEMVTVDATGLSIGELNITVETEITNGVRSCRHVRIGNGFKDTLRKPIRVKPEGVPVEIVESEFKCVESSRDDNKFER